MKNVLRTCSLLAMGLRDIDFLPVPSLFLFYHALCPSKGAAEAEDYMIEGLLAQGAWDIGL